MPFKKHKPEEIIGKLRDVEIVVATPQADMTGKFSFSLRFMHNLLIGAGAGQMPPGQQSASSATMRGAL